MRVCIFLVIVCLKHEFFRNRALFFILLIFFVRSVSACKRIAARAKCGSERTRCAAAGEHART